MRISDWSSDVCSSDLVLRSDRVAGQLGEVLVVAKVDEEVEHLPLQLLHPRHRDIQEIGRASCRERVLSVRVDLGGRRIIKKKKAQNIYNTTTIHTSKQMYMTPQKNTQLEYKLN